MSGGPSDSEEDGVPADFAGVARLFPLPNLVMFPHAIQQLHLYEPRYVAMLENALAGDRLIAMALLAPGWEKDYDRRPPVAPVACLGRVMVHAQNENETHNIILQGIQRIQIDRELPPETSYRTAEVTLLDDRYPAAGAAERPQLRQRLLDLLRAQVPKTGAAQEQFEQLLQSPIPLGTLTDILASTIELPLRFQQQLLDQCNVDQRAAMLLGRLGDDDDLTPRKPFPPPFSVN